jgi:hypothetical protein
MFRLAIAVTATVMLVGAAQQLNLANVTCKEFQASDKETVPLVLMWRQAYESGWRQDRRLLRQESGPQRHHRRRRRDGEVG